MQKKIMWCGLLTSLDVLVTVIALLLRKTVMMTCGCYSAPYQELRWVLSVSVRRAFTSTYCHQDSVIADWD